MLDRFWRWLFFIPHSDTEYQRRGQNIVIVGLMLIIMVLLSLPLVFIQPEPLPQLLTSLIGLALIVAVLIINRRGQVEQASVALVTLLVVSFAAIPFATGQIGLNPVYAVVAVVTAAVIGRERTVALAALVSILGMVWQWWWLAGSLQDTPGPTEVIVVGIILTAVCGVISGIGARSVQRTLGLAQRAQAQAETLARQLTQANQDLETRIAERTAALQAALAESEQRQAALAAALAENERQRREIQAMSVPVLAVRDGMLVMPLIGALDGERIALAQQRALQAIEQAQGRLLLLDITGVPFLDQTAADGLIALAQSARLLGAQVVLIGVSPEVAQTLVSLGIDLSNLQIARDLRDVVTRAGQH